MITGVHILLFSKQPEEVRKFLDATLKLRSVDAGDGWPIFATPPAEIAVHPTDDEAEHQVYLMCDDIKSTVAQLHQSGVQTKPVADRGWGLVTAIEFPNGETIGLYEPRHPLPLDQ